MNNTVFKHLPILLMLVIYIPATIFGILIFKDEYAFSFLGMLMIFVICYYALYPRFSGLLHLTSVQNFFWKLGGKVDWEILAWLMMAIYLATIITASLTVPITPIGAALRGGDWLDIAKARADFLANREGLEALLRYSAVIIGRAILPYIVVSAFWSRHKFRYLLLIAILLCYIISLEKASPVFLFLPLILLSLLRKKWASLLSYSVSLMLCIGIWTFISMGGLHKNNPANVGRVQESNVSNQASVSMEGGQGFGIGRHGDPRRHFFFNYLNNPLGVPFYNPVSAENATGKLLILTNRVLWVPYITAYDWLRFQDEILAGHLTMGRSIGVVSWIIGEPKMPLERMVYEYEFGVPEGGAGASNTVFIVDAKIAFGWLGVIVYSILATFFSSIVLSSNHQPAIVASVTSFFTLCLSPLTATLLSGGLFFYILVCMLKHPVALENNS